ncbi:hypothetical protein D3C81_1518910 [compost metagenome]
MRKRRICSHTACVWTLVTIKYLFMILCCRHRAYGLPIHKSQNRHFLSFKELLNDNLTSRITKHFIYHNILQSLIRIFTGKSNCNPFTCCQSISLDHYWKRLII